jgi:competence protein ComEC
MQSLAIPFWKKAPFVRLFLPLCAGILLQWYQPIKPFYAWIVLIAFTIIIISFSFIPFFSRYRYRFVNGVSISFMCLALGILLAWHKNIHNDPYWFNNFYRNPDALILTLDEPLIEKPKSYKVNASVDYLLHEGSCRIVHGKIILYLKKDPAFKNLTYGSTIVLRKPLQEIAASGNPGGFDYKRYSLFQGITHQVYLMPGDFELLPGKKIKYLQQFIYDSREWVLNALRKNIAGDKELGLGEAILVGYKNDLDKELVQSYSNTGVVHVIAISGLHLGLIYALLFRLFKPLQRRKKWRRLAPLMIISGLWLFSLLTGAQPSVLRSALMFTCVVSAEFLGQKTSILNSLACSAFILLCINPYWLWDVGFQLSYAAVLSLVLFMRHIYNWFYFKNKLIDLAWQLNAVTLSAQVLTLPFCIFHFHQFPNYFLLTNFLAVPLSSLILMIEIALCLLSFIPALAAFIGKILSQLIIAMNLYVERIEILPWSLWEGIQINPVQAILLAIMVCTLSYWLINRSVNGLVIALSAFLGFASLRSYSFFKTANQQTIIIYNIPQTPAIDFVEGRHYFFVGDSSLINDEFARNFYLKPSRTMYRISPAKSFDDLAINDHYISYCSNHILLVDGRLRYMQPASRQNLDLLVLYKNPGIRLEELARVFIIKQVVAGSISQSQLNQWKKDCELAGIPFHELSIKGAFVMKLR